MMSVSPWFYLFSYSVCFIYFLIIEIAGSAPLFHVSIQLFAVTNKPLVHNQSLCELSVY